VNDIGVDQAGGKKTIPFLPVINEVRIKYQLVRHRMILKSEGADENGDDDENGCHKLREMKPEWQVISCEPVFSVIH
jgi:hypothetical protein